MTSVRAITRENGKVVSDIAVRLEECGVATISEDGFRLYRDTNGFLDTYVVKRTIDENPVAVIEDWLCSKLDWVRDRKGNYFSPDCEVFCDKRKYFARVADRTWRITPLVYELILSIRGTNREPTFWVEEITRER